jgi:hypothetical protein
MKKSPSAGSARKTIYKRVSKEDADGSDDDYNDNCNDNDNDNCGDDGAKFIQSMTSNTKRQKVSSSGLRNHNNKDDPILSELKKLDDDDNPLVCEMIANYRHTFMSRAFLSHSTSLPEVEDVADMQLWCRPQEELDYIVYVLSNWKADINLKTTQPGIERDELIKFCREHKGGDKFKRKYHLETIKVPGADPRIVLQRNEHGKIGRIVVSRESVFQAIDEWHRQQGHLGQERTWGYCCDKYYNISQALVTHYCKTCLTCMHKKPVTKQQKGSWKPILSCWFRLRFQIDLVDMRTLHKRDPFGVMMRWIMTVKDHATGFVFICALPRKRADFVAYKLQEFFGVIGYPIIFHTDNGKEFTAKVILCFL